MFFDLNVPVHRFSPQNASKKGKQSSEGQSSFSIPQINAIEARVDILVHCQRKNHLFSKTIYRTISSRIFCHRIFTDGIEESRPKSSYQFPRWPP